MQHAMRAALAFGAMIAVCAPALRADPRGEEEARFLPGPYYFHKGCEYYKRGDAQTALQMWELGAFWAMKDAQYDLGIAYFRGRGVEPDRPRGLAWLALAAERKDDLYAESLAAAWDDATPAEHDRANALWRELRGRYGDAVALPRAQHRYQSELDAMTGSRVGTPGHLMVHVNGGAPGFQDVAAIKDDMQRAAERNFGTLPTGTVDVGPLLPVLDEGARADGK